MDRRRSLLLLLVLALAALGIVLALLPAAEPGRPVDVARAPATEDAGDLPAPAAPGVDGEEPATDAAGTDEGVAASGSSSTSAPAAVRLTGRLVAAPLAWGWVQAVPTDPGVFVAEPYWDEEDDDLPDVQVDADGVPTVTVWRAVDPEGAAVGRPAGGWAVPERATRVDATGAFSLELAPGRWVLLAGARGCTTRVEALTLVADRDVTWPLERAAPATLALTCLAANGEPLALGRLECAVVREAAPPVVVAVGDGPWSPLDLEGLLEPGDRSASLQLHLDGEGRALVELPPGRVRLGDEGGLDVGHAGTPASGGSPLVWPNRIALPSVDLTLAPGERRDVTLRQAASRGAAVQVRVRSPSGAPVVGAQVGLCDSDEGPACALLRNRHPVAVTGADGRVTILEQGRGAWFAVARGGGRSGRSPPRVVRPGERAEVEVVLDELDPYGAIQLRAVAAETGLPLPGVDLRLRDLATGKLSYVGHGRVGPGIRRLELILPGLHRVVVEAPGRAAREVEVEVLAGDPRQVEVALAPAAVVAGRIVGATLRDSVSLYRRTTPPELVTSGSLDAQGRFRLDRGSTPGEALLLRVQGPTRFAHELAIEAPAEVALTLPDARTEVRVVDATGRPAGGARVFVSDARGQVIASGSTDAAGLVVLLGDPPAHARSGATVWAEGGPTRAPFGPATLELLPPPPPRPPGPPAQPMAKLSGTVLDPDGRPAASARVWARELRRGARSDETRADGAFSFEVPVGPQELVVQRADLGCCAQRVEVGPGGLQVVVRLQRAVPVRVRAPATVLGVACLPDGWGSPAQGVSTKFRRADGAFDLGLLLPGRWTLSLRGMDEKTFATRSIEVTLPGPLVVTLE